MPVDAVDDLAVHLDQTPIRVVGEPRIARRPRLTLDGDVVQAEVQDRVHHPRHRHRRARPHRDEQRIGRIAEPLAGPLLERRDVLARPRRRGPPERARRCHVRAARVGRDREPRRHGHAQRRHLGQADPLATEELAAARSCLVVVVDVAHAAILAQGVRSRRATRTSSALATMPAWENRGRGGACRGNGRWRLPDRRSRLAARRPAPGPRAEAAATGRLSADGGRRLRSCRRRVLRRVRTTRLRAGVREVVRDPDSPAERVAAADVVVVCGGNTANLLALWRLHGIDRALRQAWEGGAALGGVSAGANCWFEACVTDSFSVELDGLDDGLGFLAGSYCPHFDGEERRRPVYTTTGRRRVPGRDRLRRRCRGRLPGHRAGRGRRGDPGRPGATTCRSAGMEPIATRLLR